MRTIDGIVRAHQAASELRAAGKPIWPKSVKLKDLFSDDTSPEALAAVANGVAARLREALPKDTFDVTSDDFDQEIDDIAEDFETMTAEGLTGVDDAQELINDRLSEIYDWADVKRVWIG